MKKTRGRNKIMKTAFATRKGQSTLLKKGRKVKNTSARWALLGVRKENRVGPRKRRRFSRARKGKNYKERRTFALAVPNALRPEGETTGQKLV